MNYCTSYCECNKLLRRHPLRNPPLLQRPNLLERIMLRYCKSAWLPGSILNFPIGSVSKCTTASQPQSLAIFWIAGEIARNFHSEKQIRPFFIAKRIATATVSLPQRNRNLFPRKNRCVQFDRVNESQTSTANHRRETVHLGPYRRGGLIAATSFTGTVSDSQTLFVYFACSPEEFCEYFFFVFAWEFCIEKWWGFLVSFFWSPSPTKRSTKKSWKNSGKIRSKIQGKIRDENSKNSGNFRSATFLT